MIPIETVGDHKDPLARGEAPDALKDLFASGTGALAAPEVGATFAGFEVQERLSEPGRTLTLKVRDDADAGNSLVLKELADGDTAERARALVTQAMVAASKSTATALPRGFVAEGGHVFLVRAFLPGVSLAAILKTLAVEEVPPDSPTWRLAAGARGGGANVTGAKIVCRIGQYTAKALKDVHERGAVHGAVSPENLICDDTVKPAVTDFGVGHPRLPYDAPEVLKASDAASARDASADLYALGALMHESLTRVPLFGPGDDASVRQATLSTKPVSPLKLNFKASKEMTTITLALLEKTADARYESAAELEADLNRYHKNEPIERKAPGIFKRLFG